MGGRLVEAFGDPLLRGEVEAALQRRREAHPPRDVGADVFVVEHVLVDQPGPRDGRVRVDDRDLAEVPRARDEVELLPHRLLPAGGARPRDRPVGDLQGQVLDERAHRGEEEGGRGAHTPFGPTPVRRDVHLLRRHVGDELHAVHARRRPALPPRTSGQPEGQVSPRPAIAHLVEAPPVEQVGPHAQLRGVVAPRRHRVGLVEPHRRRDRVPELRDVRDAHAVGPPLRRRPDHRPGDRAARRQPEEPTEELRGRRLGHPRRVEPVHERRERVARQPDQRRATLRPPLDPRQVRRVDPPQLRLGRVPDRRAHRVPVLVVDAHVGGADAVGLLGQRPSYLRLLRQGADHDVLPRLHVDPDAHDEARVLLEQVVERFPHRTHTLTVHPSEAPPPPADQRPSASGRAGRQRGRQP